MTYALTRLICVDLPARIREREDQIARNAVSLAVHTKAKPQPCLSNFGGDFGCFDLFCQGLFLGDVCWILTLKLYLYSFAYSGKKEDYLYHELDIGVDCDSRIALVGPNGCGKSTLLKLMARTAHSSVHSSIHRSLHLVQSSIHRSPRSHKPPP